MMNPSNKLQISRKCGMSSVLAIQRQLQAEQVVVEKKWWCGVVITGDQKIKSFLQNGRSDNAY